MSSRLARFVPSPTLETLLLLWAVYVIQLLGAEVGIGPGAFILGPSIATQPWTLVTTVYAHAGPIHLVTNVLLLVPAGLFVERVTTRSGFHALFYLSGLAAAVVVVLTGAAFGVRAGALGASGAVFALIGYAITGGPRRQTRGLKPVKGRRQVPVSTRALFVLLGGGLVVFPLVIGTRPLVALGHAVGFSSGLIAGALDWGRPGVETEV